MTVFRNGTETFPMIFTAGGALCKVTFNLRDFRGRPATNLGFYIQFINYNDADSVIGVPNGIPWRTGDGIIQLDSIEIFPRGFMNLTACASGRVVASGRCRYSTRRASRLGAMRHVQFDGERESRMATDSESENQSRTHTDVDRNTNEGNASVGAGGVAIGGSISRAREQRDAVAEDRRRGTSVPRPVPADVFNISQVFPD